MTPDEKHSLNNREILKQPIQIQLSKEQKIFSQIFIAFPKSILILNILKNSSAS